MQEKVEVAPILVGEESRQTPSTPLLSGKAGGEGEVQVVLPEKATNLVPLDDNKPSTTIRPASQQIFTSTSDQTAVKVKPSVSPQNDLLTETLPTEESTEKPKQRRRTMLIDDNGFAKMVPIEDRPKNHDVIFGRGEPTRKHPGNLVLREFVNRRLDEYMQTTKTRKSAIIGQVIQEIIDTGARYLVPLDTSSRVSIFAGGCRQATRTEIRSKVSHAFRDGEKRTLLRLKKEAMAAAATQIKAEDHNPTSSKPTTSMDTSGKGDAMNSDAKISQALNAPNGVVLPPVRTTEADHEAQSTRFDGAVAAIQSISNNCSNVATPATLANVADQSPAVKAPAVDLLSFATILTSLRENSPVPTQILDDTASPAQHLLQMQDMDRPSIDYVARRKMTSKRDSSGSKKTDSTVGTGSSITQSLEAHCRETDIVFGRGAPLRRHQGNIKFRKLVETYNAKYGSASKHEKTEIIKRVIQDITDTGARFLMMEGGSVKEASADEIRMKVSHRFRDFHKGTPVVKRSSGASTAAIISSTSRRLPSYDKAASQHNMEFEGDNETDGISSQAKEVTTGEVVHV